VYISVKQDISGLSVAVLIGPYSPVLQLIAEADGLPYLITTAMISNTFIFDSPTTTTTSKSSLLMVPTRQQLTQAIADLVVQMQWKDTAVIYDNDDGMMTVVFIHSKLFASF